MTIIFWNLPRKVPKMVHIRIFHSSIPNLKLKMVDIIFWSTDFGGQSYRFNHDRPFVSQEFLVETAHTISLILLHETSPVLKLVKKNWRNRNLKKLGQNLAYRVQICPNVRFWVNYSSLNHQISLILHIWTAKQDI